MPFSISVPSGWPQEDSCTIFPMCVGNAHCHSQSDSLLFIARSGQSQPDHMGKWNHCSKTVPLLEVLIIEKVPHAASVILFDCTLFLTSETACN